MNDLVSILIPVFNIEDYIGKCIESVIQQSYTNIEIIVVDDGSTDKSGEICRQFADKDSRIIYIYQENKGSVGARKTGLIQAKGKYIVFVDGDDYAERDYVEKLYELIGKNDVDFVYTFYMVDGKMIRVIKRAYLYREEDLDLDCRISLLRNLVFEWDTKKETIDCNLYGCIYKKQLIDDCFMNLSDSQQYGEDLLCLCNLIMKGRSMMFVPESYYHHVIRENSLDNSGDFMTVLSNVASLYKEIEGNLKKHDIFSALSEKCKYFFAYKVLFVSFKFTSAEKVQFKENYALEFPDLLMGKKIVIYGAGMVGQSIYEQLTNYESIGITGWVDRNYRKIHRPYRDIGDPALLPMLDFDYIVLAVKEKKMAEEIIDYLVGMGIDKRFVLWQPYVQSTALSIRI